MYMTELYEQQESQEPLHIVLFIRNAPDFEI